MKAEEAQYVAIAAAQMLLSREVPIEPDGKWGNFTQSAYDKASPGLKQSVNELLRHTAGITPEDLLAKRMTQKAAAYAKRSMVDNSDMKAVISQIAEEEGVPVSTALKIARLESNFNPNAKSPTGARGLFQLTGTAIEDLRKRGKYAMDTAKIFDPVENTRAAMKYIKLVAHDMGVRLDDTAAIYMGFNIGPTGAGYVLAGKPELAAKQIKVQAYGPPNVYAVNLRQKVAMA